MSVVDYDISPYLALEKIIIHTNQFFQKNI